MKIFYRLLFIPGDTFSLYGADWNPHTGEVIFGGGLHEPPIGIPNPDIEK